MTRWDKLIFLLLILGATAAIAMSEWLFSGAEGLQVVVEVDGQPYGRYALEEKNGKTLAISTEFGYNKIVIENGGVWVMESDCPDHLEVKAGVIQKSGEMLVCLPNRLVIRIEGGREVDGVVY